MKIAYIAHPISGDVEGNIRKILEIIKEINLEEPETIPFCPYLPDVMAMDDNMPAERERGLKNTMELIWRVDVDELRLYGDKVSSGMIEEVMRAFDYVIPVNAMTKETKEWMRTFKIKTT